LRRILCEPYAENPGPNRLLAKLGFRLVKRYRTVPGVINFDQEVNLWQMDAGDLAERA
jgi:[ribosomal protein S5]-alanine N-acetyltransferase